MLKSDWLLVAALGGCLALAGLARYSLEVQTVERQFAICQAAHQKTDNKLGEALSDGSTISGSPSHSDKGACRNEWRQEKELQAQQQISLWSLLMLLATVVGVVLIWQNLIETSKVLQEAKATTAAANETVKETTRIGEAQVRAYLSYSEASVLLEPTQATFHMKVKNVGQSPAKRFGILDLTCEITTVEPDVKIFKAVEFEGQISGAEIGQIAGPVDHPFKAQFRFSQSELHDINSRMRGKDIFVFVRGIFWYVDVFNRTIEDPFIFSGRLVGGSRKSGCDFLTIAPNRNTVAEHAKQMRAEKQQPRE